MSTIEKMSVQGVRSFGPDDPNKQVITFFKPLTLILGPNGTGKTTVIECLKYMTTGDMPPGSKGGAFIHDPKVAHEREVKGQIRLLMRDMTGQRCSIQRSITATQKVKKIETRTLDGVISRWGPDGQKKSITSRCAELDKEMVTALGVSKAVLDNVIFCHQEESNWPLCEGKALKEKFDAIFASTRYTKVLETIRKLKQEQDGSIKLYKQDLKYLKDHKDKAAQLQSDLEELSGKAAASKESVAKITEQLGPIEERLDQIHQNANEIYKVKTKIEKLESEKGQLEKNIQELQDNIEHVFQGSTEELKRVLEDFEDKLQERKDTVQQMERRKEELSVSVEKLGREKSQLQLEVGKLQQEAQTHKENVEKRDNLIRTLAAQYEFEGFERGQISDEKYKYFFENVRSKLEGMVADTRELKTQYEEKEASIQKKMDDLRDSKTKLEQSERIKRDLMTKNSNEIRQINQKLSHMEASAGRLDQLTRDLKGAELDLSSTEGTVNLEDLKREITLLDKDRRQLDTTLSDLNSEMNRLNRELETQTQLDMLKKERTSKEDIIRRLKAKHEDGLTYLLGHMPTTNIRGQLEDFIGQQTEQVKQCSTEVQKAKTDLSSKEAEKNMLGRQIKDSEQKLTGLEEKIFDVCGSQDFDDGLKSVQSKMAQAQDKRGSLLGAEHFFKKYQDDLKKDSPCCPLCHREFATDQEVRELILELQDKLRLVPTHLTKAEKDLDDFQLKYDNMTQLKPLRENIVTLRDEEIPQLKNKQRRLNEEIQKLRDLVQNKEDELQAKETDEVTGKSMQPDIVMMDRYYGEIRELDKKIATHSSMLSGGDSGRTLETVIGEKEDKQMQLDTINRKLDHKRQKMSDHSEHVQKLRSKVNTLKEEKLKIDSELQQQTKLEETKAGLSTDNKMHEQDIQEARTQIRPLEEQIERQCREKKKLVATKDDKIDGAKAEIECVRSEAKQVKDINSDIKQYNQSMKADRLEKSRERMSDIADKETGVNKEREEITENVNKLSKDLATQQIRERELMDNLQLRQKQKEVGRQEREIGVLQDQMGDFDTANLERERRKLLQKADEMQKERNMCQGRQQGLDDMIRNTKRELQTDMFKDAGSKYRDMMIQMRTTELANSDLEKYYRAMDKAIMNYHVQKMEEINKIIRELWRNTYRGNDIETIEIRSDDEDSGALKSRRVYHYRVVMIKGDTALDMRGRCSAGQKVLASLIIRLALAETFCVNCGILALDEPTTNLDRENIESLAYALVSIIKARSCQSNFQLVLITHDEDFVELLGRSEYVEDFYRISKDESGYSCITKSKVENLHRG
ncbi:DNA repair protein RAD50-like [Haliotis cracherodii]|uniref:DNA repair protein RAD50-like n=1 Tax=Haliotis cracherodii TaxID=6455 RepID=UPI0039EC81E5